MSDKPCPLCGREMTAIETHAGRGELYCAHCDLTIGGNEAKTPDELMELLGQRTCHNTQSDFDFMCSECSKCVDNGRVLGFNYCPKCGRRIVEMDE